VDRPSNNPAGFSDADEGSATVEFAITAAVVFALIFAAIEIGGAVYTYVVLSDAVNEGLRYAVVHSSDGASLVANTTNIVTTAATATLHDMSGMSVSVTSPDNSFTPPNRVSVSLTYAYVPYLIGFMPNPPTMIASAQGRMVY
jgi:Flp pilus assembly protein TadG